MKLKDFSSRYLDLLVNDYSSINLTRISTPEDFYLKQILDSIEPINQTTEFSKAFQESKIVIDVGFGGGFPILPLANEYPDKNFIGIESKLKKVNVVTEIAKKLSLNNVRLFHKRLEDIVLDIEDVCIISKAVAKVDLLCSYVNSNKRVKIFFYKGPNFHQQEGVSLNNVKKQWKLLGIEDVNIPNTDKRLIVGFENKNVPCGTLEGKNLVNLSHIL